VLRISVEDVLLPNLTTWGRPIGKSRIQLQREVFSPRVLSLLMSFEDTMVTLVFLGTGMMVVCFNMLLLQTRTGIC
jgi:hypothetical protein